jgi:hypothetical protein
MEAKKLILKTSCGKISTLDKEYNKHISCILENLDEELEIRWDLYNLIFKQLLNKKKINYTEELKYRLTDGENPNDVILDILDRESENIDGLFWFFKRSLESYRDEDLFKRFIY